MIVKSFLDIEGMFCLQEHFEFWNISLWILEKCIMEIILYCEHDEVLIVNYI